MMKRVGVMLLALLAPLVISQLVGAQAAAPSAEAAAGKAGGPTMTAVFAGGCFWCTESDFDKVDGVVSTTSGYIGGKVANPTYEQVSAGRTGHAEAVQVVYDPARVSYEKLVEYYWRTIDPTVKDRQFCDIGSQYRPEIFTFNDEQQRIALASKAALEKTKPFAAPIAVEVTPATTFYPAEDYHQDYYKRNPVRYAFYRNGCGRDQRLEELWGKKAKSG
jgi:peptide-methionine (S)-S-oxide reductase